LDFLSVFLGLSLSSHPLFFLKERTSKRKRKHKRREGDEGDEVMREANREGERESERRIFFIKKSDWKAKVLPNTLVAL
jgi:hypothetical protein